MAIFVYKALTQDGREVNGSIEHNEEQAVLTYLEAQGFIPVDIQEQKAGSQAGADVPSLAHCSYD